MLPDNEDEDENEGLRANEEDDQALVTANEEWVAYRQGLQDAEEALQQEQKAEDERTYWDNEDDK
ncbi:hypothetical protein [Paraburkholderia dipogonis]|uniref:hypothetical protein n=1 Tax=Paraburkholderia dipogonis TaxID=1211383 RepID=UPI0038BAA18A